MSLRGLPPADIFDKALGGERRALGRLITFVERDAAEAETVAELAHERAGNAHVIGITGAPGSGKSTLTGQLVKLLGEAGKRAAVLAVDPSSPLTGGAILGDRVRMEDVASPDTFIRSMATRGHQGGLSLAVPGVVRLLDATGYDPIVIETVGVGQVEVDIAGTADTTVVVATPGMGDSVQANKAGLLELADLFVVNKADRPGAKDVRRDLDLML
ncbi:MAG: methylmalonyl Co-A mutase-associated GTPase MeaB, partial [Acidimicrobiales bacterium]|nr:methylmalonyl Co-A mutase-associated GTPase MeaB [Acidimicrobiales bacterium]